MEEYKLVLKKAFKEVEEQELREIPEDSEIDYQFSPQFEKKMNRLIKAQKHSYWKYVNTTSKKIAVFLIAAVISLTCVMSVEASRNAIIKFFETIFGKYTRISSYVEQDDTDNIPKTIETIYTIPNLTDDFEKSYYYADDLQVITEWVTPDMPEGQYYSLSQYANGSANGYNTESNDVMTININGYSVYVYKKSWYREYIWTEKGYMFSLTIPNQTDEEFVHTIIGNLIEK